MSDDTIDDGFWETVGSEVDPMRALVRAMERCGSNEFEVQNDTIFIKAGANLCSNLMIQTTSRSQEIFCNRCGISFEVKIGALSDGIEEEGDAQDSKDELDEFLSIAGSGTFYDDAPSYGYDEAVDVIDEYS